MAVLEPRLGKVTGYPEFESGWRLGAVGRKGVMILHHSKRDLRFGCQQDCARAVQAFEEEGHVTLESLLALSDQERARIATKYLRW